ncbi:hypothetical protein Btru_063773 [Bulinus truncatus]|nr:hypothetical protein Btru_063773 [Bulinus truncatus]
MELLKQLEQASSCGLSKEEFFKLLEAEMQLRAQPKNPSTAESTSRDTAATFDQESTELKSNKKQKCSDNSTDFPNFDLLNERLVQHFKSEFKELKSWLQSSLQEEKLFVREQLVLAQGEINGKFSSLEHDVATIKDSVSSLQSLSNELSTLRQKLMQDLSSAQATASTQSKLDEDLLNKLTDVENQLKEIPEKFAFIKDTVRVSLNETQGLVESSLEKKLYESTRQLQESMNHMKNEIFNVTEKEMQIVRDRLQPANISGRKNYICDFYIPHFRSRIKSSATVYSPPWHIDQMHSCVKGLVEFNENADISVWLVHGRHPLEMGLAVQLSVKLDITATVMDIRGNLPNRSVGRTTWECSESKIKDNSYWGELIGVLPGWELIGKGYGKQEGYDDESLLIRFQIHV